MEPHIKVSTVSGREIPILLVEGDLKGTASIALGDEAWRLLSDGERLLVVDLEQARIIDSVGVSVLIEIIENLLEMDGRLAFCGANPTLEKTFHIMGVTQYAQLYPDRPTAVQAISEAAEEAYSEELHAIAATLSAIEGKLSEAEKGVARMQDRLRQSQTDS